MRTRFRQTQQSVGFVEKNFAQASVRPISVQHPCAPNRTRRKQSHPMNSQSPDGTSVPSTPVCHAAKVDNDGRPVAIAGDILYGADEIALFLFGDRKHRRRVYNLVDGNALPTFRIGVNICARKSVLIAWIATQEQSNATLLASS
jgi:hypothetical protein